MPSRTSDDPRSTPSVEDILFAMSGWPEVEEALLEWRRQHDTHTGHLSRSFTSEFLMRAIGHPDPSFRELAAEAGTSNREVMAVALHDDHPPVRVVAARSSAAPPGDLAAVAADTSVEVRRAVAANSSTPVPALITLVHDPDVEVRHAAVRQHRLPADVMADLADSDDSVVLCAVAASPLTKASTLHRLSKSASVEVWFQLASNLRTPARSLELIPAGQHPHLHKQLVSHPHASAALCRRLATTYLDEPDAPLRLIGLSLMFKGAVKVASWGEGRTDKPTELRRPSEVMAWLAEGGDLSTVVSFALDTSQPAWLRWFIVSRGELDHDLWVRLATDREPRIRTRALEQLAAGSATRGATLNS
jgi:hypothetical protein